MYYITKGGWEGVICATFGELPESDHPLITLYKTQVFDRYAAKEERWGLFFAAGILFVEPMVEALKNTGRDLTRERFVAEMEKIRGFKGIGPEVNFKPFDPQDMFSRQGTRQTLLIQCLKEGGTKRLTDWQDM
jgi:hypothetical protein